MTKLLLFAATVLCSVTASAKIWRVNNNTGITADFTSLQAAHDGASPGDTLYVEASPNNYGSLSSSKKLHIMGAGFFFEQNLNLQASAQRSQVNSINLYSGSAGSVIEGLSFFGQSIDIRVSNIVVRRNSFNGGTNNANDNYTGAIAINAPVNNILITQNYGAHITNSSTATGVLITNNFLGLGADHGETTVNHCLQLAANTTAIIKNNIFRRGKVEVFNSNVTNNIMYVGFLAGTGNHVANNIGNGTQFGTANDNQSSITMASVFDLTGSLDAQWKLKAGSPAAGAGSGSTAGAPIDCGMFGGTTPYVLSGMPPVPSIYYFANQAVGSNSDPINVQIKVRSNN